MNIWLIKEGEPIPIKNNQRIMRTGSLVKFLDKQGHKVIWWASTFSHQNKSYFYSKTTKLDIYKKTKLILLHSKFKYKKNISLVRYLYHIDLAVKLKRELSQFEKPDIIICSYPTSNFSKVILDYSKNNNIPLILDVRDMWPDIFYRVFPKNLRFVSKIFFWPLKKESELLFSKATAISSMSESMLKWASLRGKRLNRDNDQCIFIGSEKYMITEKEVTSQYNDWNKKGITNRTWNICLFASLSSRNLDMETLFKSVIKLHINYPKIRLLIGGKGDKEEYFRKTMKKYNFIHILGWLNNEQMTSLMKISKVGMLNYKNTMDFKDGWGNKVSQYLSYGLPLITSAEGEAKKYISKYNCGVYYKENDSDDLYRVLENLLTNNKTYTELSINAKKCFERDFRSEVVNKKFEKMINNVYQNYQKRGI